MDKLYDNVVLTLLGIPRGRLHSVRCVQ